MKNTIKFLAIAILISISILAVNAQEQTVVAVNEGTSEKVEKKETVKKQTSLDDSWTGFYVGGFGGYTNGSASANTSTIIGPKPFVSADWKNGDAIERARMLGDIYKNRHRLINGKTEAELLEMLSEADTKKDLNGKSVWFYNLESARQTKSKMAITIISGVGQYGLEIQRGQMTAPDV